MPTSEEIHRIHDRIDRLDVSCQERKGLNEVNCQKRNTELDRRLSFHVNRIYLGIVVFLFGILAGGWWLRGEITSAATQVLGGGVTEKRAREISQEVTETQSPYLADKAKIEAVDQRQDQEIESLKGRQREIRDTVVVIEERQRTFQEQSNEQLVEILEEIKKRNSDAD